MTSNNIHWDKTDFKDKERIYHLFETAGYKLGDKKRMDPSLVPGLNKPSISKNIESLYQVVYHEMEIQVWLILSPIDANKKSWRKLIISEVMESFGDYILFFTKDLSQYWISIIADDIIEEILFNPNTPSPKADRFIKDLLGKKPLIDPMGLTSSILQAKHELTAKKLTYAIFNNDEEKVILLFKRAGLYLKGELQLIIPRKEAPLSKTTLKILISEEYNNNNEWIKVNLANIIGEYSEYSNKELKNIIIIFKDAICYYSSKGILYDNFTYLEEDFDKIVSILTSLISCFDIKAVFNAETFEAQFGALSPFFIKAKYLMTKYLKDHFDDLRVVREEWERYFGKVYQPGDMDEELLVKHAYLSSLIKNVLFCKYLPEKLVKDASSFRELAEYFEKRDVELFINDFYAWANNIIEIQNEIFDALSGANYESEDIFRVIYQDMVSPSTRHALGEFYTPPELASLMVEEVYEIGKITLDPACGSGTFLVEIINKIRQNTKGNDEILKALDNIYGFDVNPIAVLVSKANILLNIEWISNKKLPINIFLVDSLKIIQKNPYKDMQWGNCYLFQMGNYGTLQINEQFLSQPTKKDSYNYLKEFLVFLRYIDELMTQPMSVSNMIKKFNQKFLIPWIDNLIPNCKYTYRQNLHNLIEKLSKLQINKHNHIWLFLLYNAIGPEMIKKKADLVMGNPPWLTMSGIISDEYKEEVKLLATEFNILYSKEAKNTEICTLFFYQAKDKFLKDNGVVFFVFPATILTGNQHSKFRVLEGFKSPKVWKFSEDVFNIHNICFQSQIGIETLDDRTKYRVKTFEYNIKTKFLLEKKDVIYKPAYIKDEVKKVKGKKKIIGKLIGRMNPEGTKTSFKVKPSKYRDLFNSGIRFVPRRYLVSIITEELFDNVKIIPDLSQKASNYYKTPPFKEAIINRNYLHKFITTDTCIPFSALYFQLTFFPLLADQKKFERSSIPNNTKNHYDLLDKAFKENSKKEGVVEDLWENMTYGPSTINTRENGYFLVLSGASAQKSLIIPAEEVYVDTNFYFFETKNLEEAYYLCGYLNAPITIKNIKQLGGSGAHGSLRHIHKRPFDFPLPTFQNSKNQIELANTAKECEEFVNKFVKDWITKKFNNNKDKFYCPFCLKTLTEKSIDIHTEKCEKKPRHIPYTSKPKRIKKYEDIILKTRTIQNQLNKSEEYNGILMKLDKVVIEVFKEFGEVEDI